MKKKIKSGIKRFGSTAKTIGKFGVEVARRAIVPGYADKKIFGPNFGKKKAK